ncbi:MAG: TolC family protein, partial [Burkholderiaceae bacterium]|nr:TolC family protein [Burkholderiaceae bacterium]
TTEADLGRLRHALEELLGQAAGSRDITGRQPLALPPLPATGVPAKTVARRPDVQQAWLQVRAADSAVAAAIANRFPQLNLTASYVSNDAGTAKLFDNWLGALVGAVTVPLIDGGARRAEVERARAVLDQRIIEYRRAVLAAFREVQDALLQDHQLRVSVNSLDEQLRLSDTVVDRLERQLRNGSSTYPSLLDAQIANSSLRRDRLSARQSLAEQRIALFRYLAGPLPTTDSQLSEPQ